ncbi:MAG: transposase family protein [Acidimicrobiales bacterium]
MRVNKVLKTVLGFDREVVILAVELINGPRPSVVVDVRTKRRRRGRCGRCGELASWFDNGDGVRSWRHLDPGYATVQVRAVARRVAQLSVPGVRTLPDL